MYTAGRVCVVWAGFKLDAFVVYAKVLPGGSELRCHCFFVLRGLLGRDGPNYELPLPQRCAAPASIVIFCDLFFVLRVY